MGWDPGSNTWDLESRKKPIQDYRSHSPNPGVKKAPDSGSGFETLPPADILYIQIGNNEKVGFFFVRKLSLAL
jgi:hypothetical protein